MKYQITAVKDDDVWNRFVYESPEGSVFGTSAYLSAYDHIERFFIVRGSTPKAAVYMPVGGKEGSKGAQKIVSASFLIHSGIMFEPQQEKTASKYNVERFELCEFFVEHILSKYTDISLTLHPGVTDIRAFLWHNYHEPEKPRYTTSVRYTSHLDISELFLKKPLKDNKIFYAMDDAKRRFIKKGYEEGLQVTFDYEPAKIEEFYRQTMAKSESGDHDSSASHMLRIIDILHSENMGFQTTLLRDGVPTYTTFFSNYKNTGCYLFGAGNPEIMQANDATFCFWKSFEKASEAGVSVIDLEGINSPQRGIFKVRFGGEIVPYFTVSLSGNG